MSHLLAVLAAAAAVVTLAGFIFVAWLVTEAVLVLIDGMRRLARWRIT